MIKQQMKLISITILSCAVTLVAHATGPDKGKAKAAVTDASGTYELDKAHSEVAFKVRHMMISDVSGKFTDFKGTFDFDQAKKELKNVDIEIVATSISTNNEDRDKHLRSADFFDVEKNKTITFKIAKADLKEGKAAKIKGKLTLHGVTKDIPLEATYSGPVKDMAGKDRIGFELKTPEKEPLSRKEFGLVWNKAIETGGVAVSDEVRIDITGEAAVKK